LRITTAIGLLSAALAGCEQPMTCPRAIYLDGAGWYSGDGPVRTGLRTGGYPGPVDRFHWQGLLGPVGALSDHMGANGNHPKVPQLARRIEQLRQVNPNGQIVLVGLSAGTSLIVCALERLGEDVEVDYVVLLSPSVSDRHDLTDALRHVRHRFYATISPHDGMLASAGPAGGESGRPAGLVGFRLPRKMTRERKKLLAKLIPLPWRPEYLAYGWDGGHVSATSADFIRAVITPRLLDDLPHPLDRPALTEKEATHD